LLLHLVTNQLPGNKEPNMTSVVPELWKGNE